MSRKQKRVVSLVSTSLLSGVATALILLFATLTGARLSWWAATTFGACVGGTVGCMVLRRG